MRLFEQPMRIAVPTAWQTRETSDQRDPATAIAGRAPADAATLVEAHFDSSIGDIVADRRRSRLVAAPRHA